MDVKQKSLKTWINLLNLEKGSYHDPKRHEITPSIKKQNKTFERVYLNENKYLRLKEAIILYQILNGTERCDVYKKLNMTRTTAEAYICNTMTRFEIKTFKSLLDFLIENDFINKYKQYQENHG